jgi:hypothetical protein
MASWASAEVEGSITQPPSGQGPGDRPDLAADETGEPTVPEGSGSFYSRNSGLLWGIVLILLCMTVYVYSNPSKANFYIHFVWQAQAWLDGQTSIPTHVEGTGPNNPGNSWYQDVQPILDAEGNDTNRGTIPFPPLPALVLLPFVAFWHLATNEQMLAAIFSAIDVGIAYWMLGFLPVSPKIRRLTAVFLGLGTVLWYAAAIGTTWFWAHIVALGFLLAAVGLALSADGEAAESRPLRDQLVGVRRPAWPGGVRSAATLILAAAIFAMMYRLAAAGASPQVVIVAGILVSLAAVLLAVAAAEDGVVLVPLGVAFLILAIVPAALIALDASASASTYLFALLAAILAGMGVIAWRRPGALSSGAAALADALDRPESRQVAAGILFGLACGARLTIVFGFLFFVFVGGGGRWLRRGMLAGAGAAIPLVALLVYTYASTGELFNPAYNYLYSAELGYAQSPFLLPYHANLSLEDLGYIPQNFALMFFGLPHFLPNVAGVFPGYGTPVCVADSSRGLFNQTCPLALPDAQGMSLFLTSPAYLLAPLALVPYRRLAAGYADRTLAVNRAAVGAAVAVVLIAFVNLMHFSQGWVQFGYRFSNDFAPFAIVLVALGASRLGRFWPVLGLLVVASIAINFWGTAWGVILGW